MKDSLQTLSRIEKFNINEQRKILVTLQEQQDQLITSLERLNQQFEQEKDFIRNNSMVGDFGAYVKRYMQKKEALIQQISTLEQQITDVRNLIADMFKEQKTYEIVSSNRKTALQHEEEMKLQKQLDEIGTNAYIKHQEQQTEE